MTSTRNIPTAQLEAQLEALKSELAEARALAREKDILEQEYRASKKRFETIFDESSLGKKILGADLRIIRVNKALVKILQYSKEELIGVNIVELSHPDFKATWETLREELWNKKRQSFSIDTCILKKDGTSLWCHVTSITFQDQERVLGYTIIEDISERKRLEQAELDLREQKLLLQQRAEVIKATLNTQEKERERIAEGLHNSLGQLLFAAALELNRINFGDEAAPELAALHTAKELLNQAMKECRQISHQLMPIILHDRGLEAAIEANCRYMSGDVEFSCSVHLMHGKNDKYFEIVVYRLVQELMVNIGRHSQASWGRVIIEENDRSVVITVKDNGIGFNVADIRGDGIGLSSVRNNVTLLNGTFQIESHPGKGTTVTVCLPVPGW